MKDYMKRFILLQVMLLLAVLIAGLGPAWATSKDDAELKVADQTAFMVRASSSDSKAMRIWFVGTSTEALLTITSSYIYAYTPGGTLDTDVDSDGVISLADASYDTMGEVCDYFDDLTDYECELLGVKSNDDSKYLDDQTYTSGTNDLNAVGGFEVGLDTGTYYAFEDYWNLSLGRTPPTDKRLILVSCEVDVNGSAPDIRVYGKPRIFTNQDGKYDYDLVDLEQLSDDTETVIDWAVSPQTPGLEFAQGSHVTVVAGNESSTYMQAAGNDLRCWFIEK